LGGDERSVEERMDRDTDEVTDAREAPTTTAPCSPQ
jgi:hypothetical protein